MLLTAIASGPLAIRAPRPAASHAFAASTVTSPSGTLPTSDGPSSLPTALTIT